jgi:hypothetical protein
MFPFLFNLSSFLCLIHTKAGRNFDILRYT